MSSASVILSPVRNEPLIMPTFHANSYPDDTILIYLTFPGTVIPMRVLESDSIESVKLQIQSYRGFVVKNQKLVFAGRELARSNSNMRDYGVSDGNILHLVLRLSDLQLLDVMTIGGKHCRLHVERGRNIGYVKNQIFKKRGDFVDEQEILYHGEKLEDQSLIHDICRNDDSVLHLVVQKSAKVCVKPVENNFELSVIADHSTVPPSDHVSLEPIIINPKVKLPSVVKDMIKAASDGLRRSGNSPVRSREGTGGAYFIKDSSGEKFVGVFKPIDEEPMAENNPQGLPLSPNGEGLKKGTKVGEGALREVAAYILDHPISGNRSISGEERGFAGVPPTTMVECLHSGFNHPKDIKTKIGSLQMFTENDGSCEDMGPASFPVEEVHKISVLDIRLANADRHGGNILMSKDENGKTVLVPIDHGYCLPDSFEDCTFEWLYWPQARKPYSLETMEYIRSLDAEEDIALLKFHGWKMPLETARTLRISTMLLKKGMAKGLTAFEIGNIMCRQTLNNKSLVEEMVEEAGEAVLPGTSEAAFLEALSDMMEFHLDKMVHSQEQ